MIPSPRSVRLFGDGIPATRMLLASYFRVGVINVAAPVFPAAVVNQGARLAPMEYAQNKFHASRKQQMTLAGSSGDP
jgi:hypothetical protein